MQLVGYADKLSVAHCGHISFMVSSAFERYRAELVRLIHGDTNPAGPGFKAEVVDSEFAGTYSGVIQRIRAGSYLTIPDRGTLCPEGDFTIQLWIHPTLPSKGRQTLVSRRGEGGTGFALRLENGRLAFEIGASAIAADLEFDSGVWYFVSAVYDAAAELASLTIEQTSGVAIGGRYTVAGTLRPSPATGPGDLLVAAEHTTTGQPTAVGNFYNGKIDSPKLYLHALGDEHIDALRRGVADVGIDPVAAWDFAADISTQTVTDTSGNTNHGVAVNRPTRAVTGRNWDGSELNWTRIPHQYNAIHFHDDDLDDAAWTPDFHWTVPEDLPSGVYAARVFADDDEDFIPFVVTPEVGRFGAGIALVIPTFSYLAYGNEQMANNGTLAGQVENYPRMPQDAYIVDNGLLSLYDRHNDGSGVCYASWLRPLVNMRPQYRQHWLDSGKASPHQLGADLHLVDWLVEKGYEFDVLTDLEVHLHGVQRLEGYQAVLTGTHAEYCSGEMLDAYTAFVDAGGRLMYLSGNGMFWVTQLDPSTGTGIEVRRRSAPMWQWPAAPGEAHLSSTGEPAGLWSNRGRGPHRWLGVGMNSEGGGPGRPYRRQPASFETNVAFIFEGIGDDELIGDFPALVNSWGAAGFELDWADHSWGTPAHTSVLGTADGFGEAYEVTASIMIGGAAQHPPVQADMAFVEYPNGGAVFSTGSIAWCACLSYNAYDNNVSCLTQNVLDAFASDETPWVTG